MTIGFPKPFALIMGGCVDDPLVPCPAAVHRVSINPASLFGEKYAVKKVATSLLYFVSYD